MNKREAIKKIRSIQTGEGLERNDYPEKWKGISVIDVWDTGNFSLGMEYGYILALKQIFNIKTKEI